MPNTASKPIECDVLDAHVQTKRTVTDMFQDHKWETCICMAPSPRGYVP